jgi:alpha-galactosidase
MLDYCRIIERVAPNALLLNYTNPMAMLTGAILKATGVRTVGLCHSVQGCAAHLCRELDLPTDDLKWKIAGINHQGWLLEISRHGEDLYPEIKRRAELPSSSRATPERFEIRSGSAITSPYPASTAPITPWLSRPRRQS